MKLKSSLSALLLIAATLIAAVPLANANFVSIQSILPESGNPGTTLIGGTILSTRVTVVGNAEPGDKVQILWDNAPVPLASKCNPASCVATTTAPSGSTSGTYTVQFDVPLSTAGTHLITANNTSVNTSPPTTATRNFLVKQVMQILPTNGFVGDTVQVLATGLAPTSATSITYDGVKVGDGTTDGKGTLISSFVVPRSFFGAHQVGVSDAAGNAPASVLFNVGRKLEVTAITNPTLAPDFPGFPQGFPVVGSTLSVRGTGFLRLNDTSVVFTLDGVTRTVGGVGNVFRTDSTGTLTFTDTTPQTAQDATQKPPASTFQYTATDSTGSASVSRQLFPLLTLSPDHAAFNQQVNGLGIGFSAGAKITVTLGTPTSTLLILHNGMTNSTGSFAFSFTIATGVLSPGIYLANATDQNGFSDVARFILGTHIIPTPDRGIASLRNAIQGTTVTLNGFVYTPNSQVTITFDGSTIKTVMADPNGDFTTTIQVPEALGGTGQARIAATDSATPSRTASAAFTVVSWIKLSVEKGQIGVSVTAWGTGFLSGTQSIDLRYCGAGAASDTLADTTFAAASKDGQTLTCASISTFQLDTNNALPNAGTTWNVFSTGSEVGLSTVAPNAKGSFTTSFQVPESWGGFHPVFTTAKDTMGQPILGSMNGVPFRVLPSISMTPTSGQRNRFVTLQATGLFQWESYTTRTGDQAPVTVVKTAGFVMDFGPNLRYIDQAHFILNGQVDLAWHDNLYQPIALNSKGTLIYWDSLFNRLGSIGSQFVRVPSLEPDQYTLNAYRFEVSSPPAYTTDETSSFSFKLSNPEIDTLKPPLDKTVLNTDTINGKVDSVMSEVTSVMGSVGADLKGKVDTVNGKVDSVMSEVTSVMGSVGADLKGKVDTVNGKVDSVSGKVDSVTTTLSGKASQSTVDSISQGVSNIQTSVPLVLQTPLGYVIAILAAIAALGSIATAVITSRRLKVAG